MKNSDISVIWFSFFFESVRNQGVRTKHRQYKTLKTLYAGIFLKNRLRYEVAKNLIPVYRTQ